MCSVYLTTIEAAERLGVHPVTIHRWIKENKLVARKGSGKTSPFKIRLDSVLELERKLQ